MAEAPPAAPFDAVDQPERLAPVEAAPEPSLRAACAQLRDLARADRRTNALILAREYAVFVAPVGAAELARSAAAAGAVPPLAAALAYVAAVLVIGAWVQNHLSVLLHEASHFSLFAGAKANDVLANLLVAFPLYAEVRNYRRGHWSHHAYVNLGQRDPDLRRLALQVDLVYPMSRRTFWLRYLAAQLLPWNGVRYLLARAQYVTKPDKRIAAVGESGAERHGLRIAYYVAWIVVLTATGTWPAFLRYWIVPLITVFPAILFLREIVHHGNTPGHAHLQNSRCYEAGWLERQILIPFGEWNHALHHVAPSIPHRHLRAAHERLLAHAAYRDALLHCNGIFRRRDRAWAAPSALECLTSAAGTAPAPARGASPEGPAAGAPVSAPTDRAVS
jgi:fatty acid desaturase